MSLFDNPYITAMGLRIQPAILFDLIVAKYGMIRLKRVLHRCVCVCMGLGKAEASAGA